MKRRAKHVGRVRLKLASVLEKALAEIGVEAEVEASKLYPAQGHWRTDFRADVYRWEGSIRVKHPGPDQAMISCGVYSWSPMSDCIRGLTVSFENAFTLDVSANDERVHPANKRGPDGAQAEGESPS